VLQAYLKPFIRFIELGGALHGLVLAGDLQILPKHFVHVLRGTTLDQGARPVQLEGRDVASTWAFERVFSGDESLQV